MNKGIRRAVSVLLSLLSALVFTGCIPVLFSGELWDERTEICRAAAEEWLAENLPEAELLGCTALDDGRELYSLGIGEYRIGGETHACLIDPENGKFYSDAGMETVKKEVCRIAAERLGVEAERVSLTSFRLEYRIPCQSYTDLTSSGKPKTLEAFDSSVPFGGFELSASEEELAEVALASLNGMADLRLSLILKEVPSDVPTEEQAELTELFPALVGLMKEFSAVDGVELLPANQDPVGETADAPVRYRVVTAEEAYRLVRVTKNEEGGEETEILLTEKRNPYLP